MDNSDDNQKYIIENLQKKTIICQGEWTLDNITQLKKESENISWAKAHIINGSAVTRMDSAGAWLLNFKLHELASHHIKIHFEDFSGQHQKLLSFSAKHTVSRKEIPKTEELNKLEEFGKYTLYQLSEVHAFFNFVGKLAFEALRLFFQPAHWRWRDVVGIINKTGTKALPIIALLSFTIGIVVSYQMGDQLKKYGANIFIVNLLGFSVLREFGPLLTAIMVAGRTGSAFTAQLGTMKINEEIDALDTMGITPAELLILPRIIALIIVVPLLTIWADIFGIIGGMVMAHNLLATSWHDFLIRFEQEIPVSTLLIGLGKAPVFALIVAAMSCYQGVQVRGSAESIGTRTTRSVVMSIFFIIIADGIFSLLFSKFKL